MLRRIAVLLAVPFLVLAASCSDDDQETVAGDAPGSTTTVPREGDDGGDGQATPDADVVVTLDVHGGFVPVESNAANTAEIVVLRDGRVLSGAPTTMQFPGPAFPAFQVSQADQAAIDDLVEALEALDPEADYSGSAAQVIADAPDTTVTLHRDGEVTSFTAYALGITDDVGGDARAELQAVVTQLQGLASGAGETLYEPTALRVHDITELVGERPAAVEGEPSGVVLDWPIPHDGALCVVLTDPAQVEAVLEVVRDATQLDWYRTDAGERRLVVVPALPGDPGCPDS